MIVRKLKCPQCGASKITEIETGYIYCDYCSSFMGYDFEKTQSEAMEAFIMTNGKFPPKTEEYLDLIQKLSEVLESKDAEGYVASSYSIHQLEIEMFPKRFSPKIKVAGYRNKYLNFYKYFLLEQIENNYFDYQKSITEKTANLQQNLTSEIVNNKPKWSYDKNLENYLDGVQEITKEYTAKIMKYKSLEYFPEPISDTYNEMLYKQTLSAYINYLDEDSFKKAAKYLGITTEYIEIGEVVFENKNCMACNAELKIPENAEIIICEHCGNKNDIKKESLSCLNCGSQIDLNNEKCEYCDWIIKQVNFGHKKDNSEQKEVQKSDKKPQKKKGFFSRFFG